MLHCLELGALLMVGVYQAVALGFESEDSPPVLRAKGDYKIADTIVAIARRNGIPVVERDSFVAAVSHLALDATIPAELFAAAAALLAEIGALTGNKLSQQSRGDPSKRSSPRCL